LIVRQLGGGTDPSRQEPSPVGTWASRAHREASKADSLKPRKNLKSVDWKLPPEGRSERTLLIQREVHRAFQDRVLRCSLGLSAIRNSVSGSRRVPSYTTAEMNKLRMLGQRKLLEKHPLVSIARQISTCVVMFGSRIQHESAFPEVWAEYLLFLCITLQPRVE